MNFIFANKAVNSLNTVITSQYAIFFTYIADRACSPSTYRNYGVSAKNRTKLVGPVFGNDNPSEPEMMLTKGRFPIRLSDMCNKFRELDEDEVSRDHF